MLYKKNLSPTLDDSLFKNPTCEYRAAPFWAWNCELDKTELLRQIEIFKEMGLGGFHMHVRTGLATPYMSDEYLDDISACVDKAVDEKMLAWLYDEDRWPSGAAGGIVTKDERYRARYLLFTHTPYSDTVKNNEAASSQAVREGKGKLLACFDVTINSAGYLEKYSRISPDAQAEGEKWYAYLEIQDTSTWYNNQTYVNTLDKAAIERFVEVTHEKYRKRIGKSFGDTVPAIFTDEPQFTHKSKLPNACDINDVVLPWTDDLPDTYQAAYGINLLDGIPELIWVLPGECPSLISYHFHDHVAERFASAFADTCGNWCRKNGLMLTGHMMDEPTLCSQTAALGEAMRCYRGFDLPGIDMLCAAFELTTAKQAQSAVHQYGREGMLSELYGVTGWDFDFRGHKLHGDWQAALGVTVRAPHLSWVSMAGEAKRDYPASISYQSPWYKKYSYIEDHFARVNTAMTRGKPIVKVGVIHPVESCWLHWGPNDSTAMTRIQLDENFSRITDWLLRGFVDFDLISESLLVSLCEKGSAPLKVGEMEYDAVIVPDCETLRSTTLDRLEAFVAGGGKLIFMGRSPKYTDAVVDDRGARLCASTTLIPFEREPLLRALEDFKMVRIIKPTGMPTGDFVHSLRKDGDSLWLFIAHAIEPYNKFISNSNEFRISVRGTYVPTIYDTISGEKYSVEYEHINGFTVISRELYAYDSLLVRYDEKGFSDKPQEFPRIFDNSLSIASSVPFTLDEPNVMLLDMAEYRVDNEDYSPCEEILRADNVCREKLNWPTRENSVAQPWVIENEPTTHTASLRFTIESEIECEGISLALEDAERAKIIFNGHEVPSNVIGWYVDRAIKTVALPAIVRGINTLEITLPFGRRTDLEWCYLLGNFGVLVCGRAKKIVPLPETLAFSDIVPQGLPFYGGNITYHIDFNSLGGETAVRINQYEGTATEVALDGKDLGMVVYPPYILSLGKVSSGSHRLDVKLYTHRTNAFGAVHLSDVKLRWLGPSSWRTHDDSWSYEYFLKRVGITSSPLITQDSTVAESRNR